MLRSLMTLDHSQLSNRQSSLATIPVCLTDLICHVCNVADLVRLTSVKRTRVSALWPWSRTAPPEEYCVKVRRSRLRTWFQSDDRAEVKTDFFPRKMRLCEFRIAHSVAVHWNPGNRSVTVEHNVNSYDKWRQNSPNEQGTRSGDLVAANDY